MRHLYFVSSTKQGTAPKSLSHCRIRPCTAVQLCILGYCEYFWSSINSLHLSYTTTLTFTCVLFSSISSYFGLVSFWIGRETNSNRWIARGAESKVSIEKLAVLASTWNFQNSECRFLCTWLILSLEEKWVSPVSYLVVLFLIFSSRNASSPSWGTVLCTKLRSCRKTIWWRHIKFKEAQVCERGSACKWAGWAFLPRYGQKGQVGTILLSSGREVSRMGCCCEGKLLRVACNGYLVSLDWVAFLQVYSYQLLTLRGTRVYRLGFGWPKCTY